MMKWLCILLVTAPMAMADVVVPTRTLRPGTLIGPADLTLRAGTQAGMFDRVQDLVGQEARVALFAGRPIPYENVGPPALVDRNQIVPLRFQTGVLTITSEGRSLERGGIGDRVRIMNLSSRSILFGFVQEDGSIEVRQ